MVGISRFNIINGSKGLGWARIETAKEYWSLANALYRDIFERLNTPLLPNDQVINCTKEDFVAGYDYQLGIDLILRFTTGSESTLQEKILHTNFFTVTVEHCQDWLTLEPGDWFKLKVQYYFVAYDPESKGHLDKWVLLDWTRLQRATAQNRIPWKLRGNDRTKVNAKASFIYVEFKNLPSDILVTSSERGLL